MSKEDEIKRSLSKVQETSNIICDNKSVGMIIKKDEKILLNERKKPPFGFAPLAGHVDDHGSFEDAARDEVKEEAGLTVTKLTLIFEGRIENYCRRKDGTWHYWKWYTAETEGKIVANPDETIRVGWYSKREVKKLADRTKKYLAGEITDDEWLKNPGLEPAWFEWAKEMKMI